MKSLLFVLSLYLFQCMSLEIKKKDGIKIDIIRTKSALEVLLEKNTHPRHLAKIFNPKYRQTIKHGQHHKGLSAKPTPPYPNITVPLFKLLESEFYGKVQIGSPAQTFNVLLDTSFTHSWITSVLCSPFAFPACTFRNKYDSKKSSRYISDGTPKDILTDFGVLKGFISTDDFNIGTVNITKQSFVEVEEMPISAMFLSGIDGMIGLGVSNNGSISPTPVFENILKQHLIQKPIFSFYLNRDETTVKGGTLLLGGSNPKHRNGSFTYLPVTQKLWWEFKMDKIVLNYTLPYVKKIVYLCKAGCKAFPVTGSVTISGPKKDIKIINDFISANYVKYLDRYEISCESIHKLPKIIFVLGSKKFELNGKDYVQQMTYGPVKMCLSAFKELKPADENLWGLGVSFLGHFYTEFDWGNMRIGIAPGIP